MRLCNEILIPKGEKEKIMRAFYKKNSSILSEQEKLDLFSYYSDISKFEENDSIRKKKFFLEFTVLKLIKNFLKRQKSIVKQTDLGREDNENLKNFNRNSLHSNIRNNTKVIFVGNGDKSEDITEENSKQGKNSNSEMQLCKYQKKLKNLKYASPKEFKTLYSKFQRAKEKYENNLKTLT